MGAMADEWKPNLFIPGFSKCGTTALCDYLSQHPDIYIIDGKEPRTLSLGEKLPSWWPWITDTISGKVCMDYSVYKDLFSKHAGAKYRGDGSWSYSLDKNFANRLQAFSQNARILVMIRDQKKRLASTYLFTYVDHREPSFSKWIDRYLLPDMESFLFRSRIESCYRVFGDNFRVIENGALKKSPGDTMNSVFDFLGLANISVEPLSSNIGQYRMLVSEPDRKAFSNSYNLAYLAGAPARTILNRTGRYGQGLKSKLARFSPTLYTERKFAETNAKDAKEDYASLILDIPEQISSQLDCDYADTLSFCREKQILFAQVS